MMKGESSNALTVALPVDTTNMIHILVFHEKWGSVTLELTAGTIDHEVNITGLVNESDIKYGQFQSTAGPTGPRYTLVTLTGRMAVRVEIIRSSVPDGTKLMYRGQPVVAGNDLKKESYFVMDVYEGSFKICSGGTDMEQWALHSVKANEGHPGYQREGADAGSFLMDFYLGEQIPDEPAPVTREMDTTLGKRTRGGDGLRGGGGPPRSYAAQFHKAGNSGHKTHVVKMNRMGPTATCSWRNRVSDKVKLDKCPLQFCSSEPAPIQADPESEEEYLDDLDDLD